MTITDSKNNIILLGVLFLLVIFVKLGVSEIQPWDEGLYAMRAEAVLVHDDSFIDQSKTSLGGLYSGTYPPLTVWAIAGSICIFGDNPFAVRFYSALCSVISLLLVYLICRKFLSEESSVFACLLLFASTTWNYFSRLGMTDIPLMMYILLCFYAAIRIFEGEDKKTIILFSILFALSFALGLMTKIIKPLLPAMFLASGILFKGKTTNKIYLFFAVLIGLILASPWYIYMINEHGYEFYRALFVPHIYSVVEGNAPKLGLFYFFNQLLVSNPFVVIAIIASLTILLKTRRFRFDSINQYIMLNSAVWFLGLLIVFSISITKLLHYTVYMLPPVVIVCVIFYEQSESLFKHKRLTWLIFSILIISAVWSFFPDFRIEIKDAFSGLSIDSKSQILIMLIFVLLFLTFLPKQVMEKFITKENAGKAALFVLVILITRIVFLNAMVSQGIFSGAEKTVAHVKSIDKNDFLYIYHQYSHGLLP